MESLRALSVKQPWASLIATGKKTIETRIWSTEFRGDLLICSSKKIDTYSMKAFDNDLFSFDIEMEFPTGVALCLVELYDCRVMTMADEEKALCSVYGDGRWKARSFFLRKIRRIKPIPIIGELGIFDTKLIFKSDLIFV